LSAKLPTRFLKFCLEAEKFDLKDAKMKMTKNKTFLMHLFVCLLQIPGSWVWHFSLREKCPPIQECSEVYRLPFQSNSHFTISSEKK